MNLQGSRFGDNYLLRAAVAKNQIYVVPADEAVYPVARIDGNGRPPDGRNRYRLVLDPPPADAFWSLTVYGTPGPLVANPLNRYAIGDRTPGLVRDREGRCQSHLQHDEPDDGTANWLPVPAGPFHLMLRLYWPQPAVLEGSWYPPSIEWLDDPRTLGRVEPWHGPATARLPGCHADGRRSIKNTFARRSSHEH